MDFLQNQVVIDNLTHIIGAGLFAFVLAFLLTPWIGKLAYAIKAVDLPVSQLKKTDRAYASRINEAIKPRLGGLSALIAVAITLLIANPEFQIRPDVFVTASGIFLALIIVGFIGFLDDKYSISGFYQLIGQVLAAVILIYFGIAIPDSINIINLNIDLNTATHLFTFGSIDYLFVFPGHIITVIWVVAIINFINWVGGVDGLNISVTSIIAFTMLLFALSVSNIPLAILIATLIGANMGLFPYNYYPSHIIPGSVGDYLNGLMIAVFALLGDTRWTITAIVLAIPVIDALFVIFIRMRKHPEVLKNPIKILSINDTNHLHHRIMAAGYSRKTVLLIEIAIVSIVCAIALAFGIEAEPDDTSDQLIIASGLTMTFIISTFTVIFLVASRNKRKRENEVILRNKEEHKQAVVTVMLEDQVIPNQQSDEEERFAY